MHLHVHSAYSLREGALTIETLAKLAKADAMPAMAIGDTNNLFGALEFSEKLAKSGVQPIIGAQTMVDFGDAAPALLRVVERDSARAPIVLLAQNETGYRNLMRLVSALWLDPTDGDEPHIPFAGLRESDGLIALTGGPSGPIDRALRAGHAELAESRLRRLAEAFGARLYVEIQRHGLETERAIEPALIGLADRLGLPLVATNEPYFAYASDYEAHDALLCVAEGALISTSERRRLSPEHRFKTRAEMTELFADLSEATEASVEIAMRCAYRPLTRKPILPRFFLAGGGAVDEEQELRRQASEGLRARLEAHGLAPGLVEDDYRKRLAFELDVIVNMAFAGYFLIVADFIQWAKAQGIPVGPGRGSGAGSVAAWALTITDLDPLRFGLLFERFLNPERVSMPDFDIDFCQERRDEVIAYVRERYGQDRVAQIITFGSFLARGVDAQRRPGARNAARPGRQARQARAAEPGQSGDAETGFCRRGAAAGSGQGRREGGADAGHRRAARGALFQRLDPCRRSRHRRPAADRACAALPRSEVGDAGDPVQHEMGRIGRAREVRLSGSQDADGAQAGDRSRRAARNRGRPQQDPARRREDLSNAWPRRGGRRVPGGKRRHAQGADGHARRPVRGPDRAGRTLSAGADGQHSPLLRAQARSRKGRIRPSAPGADPQGHLRRHHLSGAGAADRQGPRRLFAGAGRPPAPRNGQENQEGDGRAARAFRHRRGRSRHRQGDRRRHFRRLRQIRRIRLQQVTLGALRLHHLPDRMVQGEPSGGIPRRLDDARQGQYRQARRVPRRGAAPRNQGRGPVGQ